MRILQLIDSLEAGGAEMMAVSYANALCPKVAFSGLVATRKEGSLKAKIAPGVVYLFLQRKKTIDFKAIFRLKKFCKSNHVTHIHAHSSSYAIACMLKLVYPKVKFIWHDHDGMSEFLDQRKTAILKPASLFFNGIITVNQLLKEWDQKHLYCKNVVYLPNFSKTDATTTTNTALQGTDGKRILCLANLRPQKNHFMLIEIAVRFRENFPDWSFHLVGKDFDDGYSAAVKKAITAHDLQDYIFIYGSRDDIPNIIGQSEIGILTSSSEGLPVALLEYGFYSKPVVVTDVGQVSAVVEDGLSGFITAVDDVSGFTASLAQLASDKQLRQRLGAKLNASVNQKNSDIAVIQSYVDWLNSIGNG